MKIYTHGYTRELCSAACWYSWNPCSYWSINPAVWYILGIIGLPIGVRLPAHGAVNWSWKLCATLYACSYWYYLSPAVKYLMLMEFVHLFLPNQELDWQYQDALSMLAMYWWHDTVTITEIWIYGELGTDGTIFSATYFFKSPVHQTIV